MQNYIEDSFCDFFANILDACIRFPISVSFINIFFFLEFLIVVIHKFQKQNSKLAIAFLLSSFVYILINILHKNNKNTKNSAKNKKKIENIVTFTSLPIFYFLNTGHIGIYNIISFLGIFSTLFCLTFLILSKDNFTESFLTLITKGLILTFPSIICWFCVECLILVISLIFPSIKALEAFNVFFWLGVYSTNILGIMAKKSDSPFYTENFLIKSISPYVIFSTLTLMCTVKKILTTGTVFLYSLEVFAIILLVYSIFIMLLNRYKEGNNLANIFVNFSPYVTILFIILQFIMLENRIKNVGMNLSSYIFFIQLECVISIFILSLIKDNKYSNLGTIIISFFMIFCTFGKFNIIDVVIKGKNDQLASILNSKNMIDNGKIKKTEDESLKIDEKIKITKLVRDLNILSKEPNIFTIKPNEFKDTFGFDIIYQSKTPKNIEVFKTYRYDI